jgi:hypothetical protein
MNLKRFSFFSNMPLAHGYSNSLHQLASISIFSLGLRFACFLPEAQAQVSLDVKLPQRQFLRNQSLPVMVRIENKSGQSLKIGATPDWLSFTVETQDGKSISPVRDILAGGEFELDASESISKTLDLSEGYDLSRVGSFKLTAFARFPSLNYTAHSATVPFQIMRGAQIWEEVCGVASTSGPPRMIRYSLQQAHHMKDLTLFVRVSEEAEEGQAQLLELGPTVSFATPESLIDKNSHLHVLYQSGPRDFDYCEVGPRAQLLSRDSFDRTPSRPHLKPDASGRITIVGGVRKNRTETRPPSLFPTNATPPLK